MDGFRTGKRSDAVDYCSPALTFTWWDRIVLSSSILLVFVDVLMDSLLVYKYFQSGQMLYFALTLVFVLLPSWVVTFVSFRWYMIVSRDERFRVYRMKWWIACVLHLFQLAIVYRYLSSLVFGIRSQDRKYPPEKRRAFYRLMLWEDNDASVLRLIESFLEAVPQLLLQAYVLNTTQQTASTVLLQKATIIAGALSAAWGVVAYTRTLRFSLEDRPNATFGVSILCYLWRLLVLVPRLTALALFAVCFAWIVFPVCALRWLVMFAWLVFAIHIDQFQHRKDKLTFKAALAGIYIFCFVDMSPGKRRNRYAFYYTITFAENALLLGLWYLFTEPTPWYSAVSLVGSFCSFTMGIVFMIIYYGLMHPSASIVHPAETQAKNGNCPRLEGSTVSPAKTEEPTEIKEDRAIVRGKETSV